VTRIAFSNLAAPAWSLERCADAVREYGFDGLELRLLGGEPIDVRAARGVQPPRVPLACLDTSLRLGEDGLVDALDLAAEWGAPAVRVFGGRAEPLDAELARADQLSVRILVETHDEWSSARRIAGLLEAHDSPWLGAVWDLHHPFRTGESPREVVEALGAHIGLVHVKDAEADGNLVPLGRGVVPVRECIERLRAVGYDGWWTVEWEKRWHPELAEPEQALPHELDVLWGLLG
jgi:sugar phosphate isomerase/epimerase